MLLVGGMNNDDTAEERWHELFESAHDGVFLLDAMDDGRFIVRRFNPAEERLTGLRSDQVVGRSIEEFLPSDVAETLVANYRRCIQTGHPISYTEEIALPARKRSFATTLVPLRNGRPRILGIARDITEQVEAERALRASEERFRQLAENISEVFWMIDVVHSKTLYVSPGYEAIWGRSIEGVMANPKGWVDAIHPADRERVLAALATKVVAGTYDETYRIVRPDGTERWIRDRAFPVRSEGAMGRIVGIAEDITQVRLSEERLHQAQKIEAIGRLASGVAHDFNNILAVILANCQFLVEDMPLNDPRRQDALDIGRAAERAVALTRQITAFSRKQVMAPRVIEVNSALGDLWKMIRRILGEDIHGELVLDPRVGNIYVDVAQLEQVFLNLVINARDAMPTGGTMTIETQNVELDSDYVATHLGAKVGSYAMFAVSDNGVGMDADVRARIFEPFFTTKEKGKGTGLGLSTVYGIVKQSGGYITVYSEPNVGSTFKVYLPRVDEPPDAPLPREASAARPATETVLVLEDEDMVRSAVLRILKSRGYRVIEARTPDEARRACEIHPGAIDLLLSDVVLPDVSGPDIAKDLVTIRPKLKVVFMSGFTDHAIVRQGLLEPGVHFIQKPFAPALLANKVRAALDG
ncbi:MAG: PAS domain S-box protein [Kofleriaceae bacterium]